ncbi:type II toxin-antitoxin system PemK/MazF family toxin [Lyngbya sp. CCAP 1446/10]|uniref:type II toxin-antitoxin system PemK/MazF family toxin n=1 Tax=Lyngbya sp. CCAP 1446/10 TaxID=439293 RepID=UPI002238E6E2|nr:type II toxin-antitoxin system PemK/MazF family toxin [Lyngbya sp. CCAP 1446/10]MCW6048828.1 type II toxin-antitoxin system PemK/MazF family toxin [Lyngbya sp. CCAP 1446/10]
MSQKPNPGEVWLVSFPFSDLSISKLRPALVVARHRQELIILGIFSKIPPGNLLPTWVLIADTDSNFPQTGLLKTSLVRADKITTVNESVFDKKLGELPSDLSRLVSLALKVSLNIVNEL